MIRLMIAIPTAGMVSMDFAYSLINLIGHVAQNPPPFEFGMRVATATGSNWIENREKLAQRAIDEGYTHIMFIDDDMVFAPSVMQTLLERDKDIVLTNYLVKTPECDTFTAIGLDGERVSTNANKEGLEKVAASGFGVSCISTEIFKSLPQPWFMPTWSKELGYSTEDVPFFRRAREAGFDVWLDHDASKHIAHQGRKQWFWKEAV